MPSMKSKTVDRFHWLILSANISVTIFIGALVIQLYSRDSMVVPRLPDPREGARTLRSKRVQYDDFAAQVALAVAPTPKSAAPKRKPKEPEKKPTTAALSRCSSSSREECSTATGRRGISRGSSLVKTRFASRHHDRAGCGGIHARRAIGRTASSFEPVTDGRSRNQTASRCGSWRLAPMDSRTQSRRPARSLLFTDGQRSTGGGKKTAM